MKLQKSQMGTWKSTKADAIPIEKFLCFFLLEGYPTCQESRIIDFPKFEKLWMPNAGSFSADLARFKHSSGYYVGGKGPRITVSMNNPLGTFFKDEEVMLADGKQRMQRLCPR
jgi:hypothetical protein